METPDIFSELLAKAKENNDCITEEEISKYVDIDSPEYDEIEEKLEESGINILFDEAEAKFLEEEIKVDDENYSIMIDTITVGDGIRQYLHEIGSIPLLSYEDELKYNKMAFEGRNAQAKLDKIEANDDNNIPFEEYQALLEEASKFEIAREKLVNSNLRLVVAVAKKYASINRSMAFLDLVQEGNMGLMKAIEKFDYRKGFKFSTYATWWIRQSITRAVGDQSRTIRIPIHIVETKHRYVKIKRDLTQEYGRDPSDEEIANIMGISLRKIQELQNYGLDLISLDSEIGDEKDSTLEDIIPDRGTSSPQEHTIKNQLKVELQKSLSKLSPREEKIIRLRFGLDDGCPRTLEEVGMVFDITRERVRQIEAKALRKLKKPSYSSGLREFLEFV